MAKKISIDTILDHYPLRLGLISRILDRDAFRLAQPVSAIPTDSNETVRDAGGKPAPALVHPALAGWCVLAGALHMFVAQSTHRWSTRRALKRLGEHHLRDIGITREEAMREAAKPFWR